MGRAHIGWAALLALLVLGSLAPSVLRSDGRRNLYVHQAESFLQGRLDIPPPAEPIGEVSVVGGKTYVAFPPAPAVLLLPLVAALGPERTNTPLVALLLAALDVVLLAGLLGALGVDRRLHLWLLAAFFLGTPFWLVLRGSAGVWHFAQVVATTFLLLALREAFGARRAWLVGTCLAVAFLSRQLTLFTAPVLAAALLRDDQRGTAAKVRTLAAFAAPLAVGVLVTMALSAARFGSPFDSGYGHMGLSAGFFGRARLGFFSLAFVPFNALYLLLQGFHLEFQSPDRLSGLAADPFGTSILSASPFVLVSLWAPWRRGAAAAPGQRGLLGAVLLSAVVILGIQVTYISNGFAQTNAQRYVLDLWPVLLVPIAWGLQARAAEGEERLWLGAICYAAGLNVLALHLGPVNAALTAWIGRF